MMTTEKAVWTDWFQNPFKAIKAAADANGTPEDYQRSLEVLTKSAEWEVFDFPDFVDDVLQEIAGATNIVCQWDAMKDAYRAAYDV